MADRFLNIDLVLEVQEETQFNVYKFGYGDGYEQMRPSGINSKVRSFNIKTRPLESSDMSDLRSILNDACEGDFIVAELRPYLNNPIVFVFQTISTQDSICLTHKRISSPSPCKKRLLGMFRPCLNRGIESWLCISRWCQRMP